MATPDALQKWLDAAAGRLAAEPPRAGLFAAIMATPLPAGINGNDFTAKIRATARMGESQHNCECFVMDCDTILEGRGCGPHDRDTFAATFNKSFASMAVTPAGRRMVAMFLALFAFIA